MENYWGSNNKYNLQEHWHIAKHAKGRTEFSEHIKSLSVLINTDIGGAAMADDAIHSLKFW